MTVAVLKELNPELRYALLPTETYQLKVPEEKAELFLSKIEDIKTSYSPPPMYVFHRVRRGETLSGIAYKYKTSIRAISNANNIGKSHRIIAGNVLKIPSRAGAVNIAAAANQAEPEKPLTYIVQRGDNLWNIAGKFSTTTKTIMAANKLSDTHLNVGQTLNIASDKHYIIAKEATSTYKVQSGDSLFSIAKKHRTSLNRILDLNHLNKSSKIFPGQNLIIE